MSQPTVTHPYPVLFIHGLWIHASSWEPWQELFRANGYTTSAPGWPGEADTVHETRNNPRAIDGVGILAICQHYAALIDAMPAKPIVVGHSFGGLIAQELLANGYATAAVAIDPAPIKGVKILPFSQLRSGLPVLGNPANKKRDRLADCEAVPLQLRQHPDGGGVRRTVRKMDYPRSRPALVRGCHRKLREGLTGRRRHPPRAPRTAAAGLRYGRPHRPAVGHRSGVQTLRGQPVHHRLQSRSTGEDTPSPWTPAGGTSPP